MKAKALLLITILATGTIGSLAQTDDKSQLPVKVSHAEPIYFDLIRDLGARKGEKELNVGMGVAGHGGRSDYSYLVEYEFAPVNRLGLEIEVPIAFRQPVSSDPKQEAHRGVEGIKAAAQYSFFVSEKLRTTMAVGYIFEKGQSKNGFASAHNPFFIVAKRWGRQFHSLLYTGPMYEFDQNHRVTQCALINASVHYVITGTRNFIGVEVNSECTKQRSAVAVRPQIKMGLSPLSSLGLAVGMSNRHSDQSVDFLIRWIYEFKKKA